MPDTNPLGRTLRELPGDKAILLDNETCVYCGTRLSRTNDTKEHVIGRRFVPKGKLNAQWNLIVRACKTCNGTKSDLENDISGITMQPDASGQHPVDDEDLLLEAKRKACNGISRLTGKPISESSAKIKLELPFGLGVQLSLGMSAPPQIADERIYQLARMQISAFFYWITYDPSMRIGRFWQGSFFAVHQTPRSDWGNPRQTHFMQRVVDWEPRVLAIGADGFFKAAIRRNPEAICWSWAVEWNHNYRVIGFFGEESPVRELLIKCPAVEATTLYQRPNESVHFRFEAGLKEGEDCLFQWKGCESTAIA